MEKLMTPIGERKINNCIKNLLKSVPTLPANKPKPKEYMEKGYKVTWYEKNNRMCTDICPV